MFYERLQTDFDGEVRRLAAALDVPLTAGKVSSLLVVSPVESGSLHWSLPLARVYGHVHSRLGMPATIFVPDLLAGQRPTFCMQLAALEKFSKFGARPSMTLRKGVVGDHVNHLTPQHWDRMDAVFAGRLGDLPELRPIWKWSGTITSKF
jgi:hypothetical protein